MTDTRGLLVRAAALKALETKVRAARAEVGQELDPLLANGDRLIARLVDGTKVGTISRSDPSVEPVVADEAAFTEWVLAEHPDEIVPRVRDSFRKAVLAKAKATGEVIPGVEWMQTCSTVSVREYEPNLPALEEAIRGNQLLALEATP